jgi:hypothetical protein
MSSSHYGVTWHEPGGEIGEGRLDVGPTEISFDGTDSEGRELQRRLPYTEVRGFRVVPGAGNAPAAPTLLLEHVSGDIAIRGAATRAGVMQDLAARLAELSVGRLRRVVLVLPLREGTGAEVRKLVEHGPPFDPEEVPLAHHEVYLTTAEAVFVFEAPTGLALDTLLSKLDVWAAAAAWAHAVSGAPRLAELVYSWHSDAAPEPPGLGL